jgi:hypothetical protein
MSPPDPPDDPAAPEPTVRQLLDAKTQAELERWFGLPSFQALADQGQPPPPEEDPELVAKREQRDRAIAAVDPALLEAHRRRVESCDSLIRFQAVIDVRIKLSMTRIDLAHIERKVEVAEPREIDIALEMRDDLSECTPQAILRDLHRPELLFDKVFEVVDVAAEQRLDAVAAVDEVMRTRWQVTPTSTSSGTEGRALLAELRAERLRSIAHFLPHIPNRRVTEP